MNWHDIIRRDAYLAGSIAARECEWWLSIDPEATAKSCGLTVGEPAYIQFVKGWYEELHSYEIDRLAALLKEQEELGKGYEKGSEAQ